MDSEGDYSEHEYYDIFLGIPESVHEALRCLQEREAVIRNTSNGESSNFTNSNEAHRQRTIESVLKLFTDTIPGDTWINFQHAAANLHRMHSLVKKRMNRVFRTSYEMGYINFSTNFVRKVRRVSQNGGYKRPLPLDCLRPLLTASSDPPLGTVRRRERKKLLTVKRPTRAVICSSPLQFNFKVLPNPIARNEVGQNFYNKPEIPSATTTQILSPSPSQSDDFCNCSSCSSSSSSSSATSSEVDF